MKIHHIIQSYQILYSFSRALGNEIIKFYVKN
jgi:hypothetical protein